MLKSTTTLVIPLTVAVIALASCGEGPAIQPAESNGHHEGAGHDHAGHDHAGHDHADHGHGDHDHGPSTALGSVEVAGAMFTIAIAGPVAPGASVHVDITQTAGPKPAALRVWVGSEDAAGVRKTKAEAMEKGFLADVETPSALDADTALWIEVQSEDGARTAASVPMP